MGDVFWAPKESDRKGLQYWALYIFYLSKFYELLDTVILVLKKVSKSLFVLDDLENLTLLFGSRCRNLLFFFIGITTRLLY